jgi:hypothetical protein
MGWPQITIIALTAMSVGISAAKEGEPRGNHSTIGALIGAAIQCTILYFGGFFG